MNRRRFLELAAGVNAIIGGCTGSGPATNAASSPSTNAHPHTAPRPPTDSPSEMGTEARSDPPRDHPDTIFVSPDGADGNEGSEQAPILTIQEALEQATPDTTIQLAPGEYVEAIQPPVAGAPGAPITITGPADAVLRSDPNQYYVGLIRRSHIHIRGLTITGLENPDRPDDLASYSDGELLRVSPPTHSDEYLRDVVIEPARIGYSPKSLISIERTKHASIGAFRVIGAAGARYTVGDEEPAHNGEIVYLGTAPGNLGTDWHPWTEYDETSAVRIHHIDNSEGHPHSEIVNTKLGTHGVLIEYCTDGGGSQNADNYPPASVALQSYDAILRWCELRNGTGWGVNIGSWNARDAQKTEPDSELTTAERRGGTLHHIYGNRVTGFPKGAFRFPNSNAGQGPADQRHFCGNEYDGPTDGDPGKSCPDDLSDSDVIGHLGGDSPWA